MPAVAPIKVALAGGESLELRTPQPDEAAAVLAFAKAAAATTDQILSYPDELPASVDEERRWLDAHHLSAASTAIAAYNRDEIIALSSLESGCRRRVAHVLTLGVMIRADWRSRGLGRAMMRALLDAACAAPTVQKVSLSVYSTNPRAIRLYEQFGFEHEGRRLGQVRQADGAYVDELIMGLWVKPRGEQPAL